MKRKIHEKCAVFGVSLFNTVATSEATGIVYDGLLATQHRGQESAGIASLQGSNILCYKNVGLVSEVFSGNELKPLAGNPVIGHAQYATADNRSQRNAQPVITEFLTGRTALAYNGSITNMETLRKCLIACGVTLDANDSEVISALIAYYIKETGDLLAGVSRAAEMIEGAFSMVIIESGGRMIAVRDKNGYRPLCLGTSAFGMAVASESCALDSAGFALKQNIRPGEIIVIQDGEITQQTVIGKERTPGGGLCIFEFVYFARPDSVIDELCVYDARFNMGRILAREHPAQADVVCGVPDSGIEAALGYSAGSGLPFVHGFVKNRYIGRSFIYPTQTQRENAVRLKLNPLKASLAGKRVVLVDDSIVRGTTCGKIIGELRDAGVAEVHMRISSPPFIYTCRYGTDIGDERNLIANRMSIDEIRQSIGADSLGFISRDGLLESCSGCALPFCTGCFEEK